MTRPLAAAVAALLALPALAQSDRATVGLGTPVIPFLMMRQQETQELLVTIRVAPGLRIEPGVGLSTRDAASSVNTDTTDLTLGLGVFHERRLAEPVDLFMGGRLAVNLARSQSAADGSDSGTDLYLAAVVGGDYHLHRHFSLGLETGLTYYSRSATSGTKATGLFTSGAVLARLWF